MPCLPDWWFWFKDYTVCPEFVQATWKYYSSAAGSFVDGGSDAASRCFCGGNQESSTGGEIKAEANSPVPSCEWSLKTEAKNQISLEFTVLFPRNSFNIKPQFNRKYFFLGAARRIILRYEEDQRPGSWSRNTVLTTFRLARSRPTPAMSLSNGWK